MRSVAQCGPIVPIAPSCSPHSDLVMPVDLRFPVGAGEGNRTLMTSLEGWGSAIELRPHVAIPSIRARPSRG